MVDAAVLEEAATAVRDGELVVYPTETVYGLGADALDSDAIGAVFAAKRRDRDDPVSLALPAVDAIPQYARPTERDLDFCREFLPGPVTVVLQARAAVPRALTGGRDRVGVRVPDHEVAQALLERVAPLTATSANVSGRESARRVAALDPEIREAASAVVDGGETPGGGSTVVDVTAGEMIRRGRMAEAVEHWLTR